MTEPTPNPKDESILPCQWGEEQSFEITLKQNLSPESPSLSETAFLRKEKAAQRWQRFPAP